MLAEYVYIQVFQTANWGLGAALSIALLLIVASFLTLMFKIVKPERLVH